jgi:3-isopropylmalate dehydrogenase
MYVLLRSLFNRSPLKESVSKEPFGFLKRTNRRNLFWRKGRLDGGETAFDTCTYTRAEVQRLAKKGFELVTDLCCVDKANVLETSVYGEKQYNHGKDYPEVTVSYEFVDAVAMRLVQWPNSYDVLITENLFGDILTDEASVISDLWD